MVSPVTMTRAQGWGSPTGLQHLLGVNPLSGYLPPLGDLTEVHLAALAGDTGRMKAAIAFHGQTLDDRDGGNRTALHFACVNGHQEIVIQLVGAKCKLNLCDSENRTPLIKAVQCQQEACATILLQHRADPNVMDIYGSTALHYAVYRQNLSIAAKLLSYNADIEATNKEGFTPLLLAVGNNKQQMVSFLIKSGANVHAVDTMKRTTLMLAVSYKAPNTIKLLLQQGVDVFCQDSLGKTVKDHAFHYDFKINQEIISEYLAERTSQMKNQGVNANFGEASLCSNSQLTPEDLIEERTNNSRNNNQGDCRKRRMSLSVASLKTIGTKMKQYLTFWYSKNPEESYSVNPLSGYTIHTKDLKEIHKVAIEGDRVKMDHIISFQSFTLNERDKNQRTALHFACVNGHRDIVMQLVDAKCKLNLCDSENRTPLIKAVQCQQKECASILLQNHACPNLLDICSNTALHYATCSQNIEIAAELLSFNADIEATNKDGFTPLLLAVSKNNQQMVEFLINKGANVHALDASKRTSLMIAVSIEAPDIIRLLLQQGVSVFCQDASGQTAKDHAAHYGFKINHKLISEYLTEKMTNFSSQNNNQGVAMLAETSLNSNYQRLSQDKVGQAIKNNSQNNSQGGEKSKESSLSSLSVKADTDDSWPTSNDDLLFEPKTCLEPSLAQQWSAFHQFKEKIGANCNTTGVENRIVLEDISFEDEIDDEIETVLKPSSVQEIPHPDIPSSDCSTVQHPPNSSVICGLTNEETAKEACRNEKSGSHITDSASAQQTNHDNLTCADEEHKSSRYDMNPALGFGEEEDTESSCESQNVCKNAAQMHIGHLSGSVDERGKHILNQQKYGGNDKSKETSLSSLSRIPNTNDSWSSSDDDFNFEPTSVVNADFSKRVAVRHQFKEKSGGAVCDTVRVENTTLLEDSHSARGNEDKTETPVRPSVQQISHPDISLPECSTLPSHTKSSAICYLANGEATKQASRNEEAVVIIENTPQEQRSEDSLISTHETHKNSRCGMDSALEPGEEKDSESPCNSKKICENTGQNYVSHLPGASDLRGKDICTQENGGVDKFTETSPNRVPDTDDSWSSSDDDLNSELKIVQNPDFSKQTSVTHQFKEKYFTMVEANCYIVKAENRALFTDSHSAGGNDDGIETPVKPSIQEISHPDISSLTLSTFPNPPKPLAVCHLANGEATKQATGNEENAITIIENAAQEKGNNNLIFVDEARISRCGKLVNIKDFIIFLISIYKMEILTRP
ncbi:uncharacterized protein LOC103124129 isoform X2 [Erinaceus europaeus]|uniref:Uncharacterized protein LOC103124129 isoform X2 n=1 Tax=Erinaceus europaeus TaxID=9365 RepID=A0ABM3XGZ2_ERIEU|nr:uncharacterized protein LOC103124129 isoform X2 [Erinaceus europaeus]